MNISHAQSLSLNGTTLTASGGAPSNCTAGGYKTLNSASVSGNCVTFTTGSFQNGAIWACSSINLNQSFKLTFTANFGTNAAAGDGMAFLLQTEGVPQVIGGRGGGIGYAQGDGGGCQGGTCPITPSVAVEFDTWNNIPDGLNDLVCNHSSIQTNGIMTAGNTLAGPACLISGGTSVVDGLDHTICITWDPAVNQYRVSFDGTQIISYNGNIRTVFADPTNVFWGFTGASGGGAQTQRICSATMLTNIASPSCSCTPPVATATPNPQTICSANPTGVTLSSSIAGTTFAWATTANANITGETTSGGTGATITDVLTNTTNTSQSVTYTVTPTASGCTGTAITVPVTVNPVPAVTNMTAAICNANSFTSTPANGTNGVVPAGTTYSWGVPVVTGGITGGVAGSGASITGTLTNPTNTAQTATYTVTPTAVSCPGATFTVTVTVNPAPAVTNMTATICGSGSFASTPANGTNGVVPAGTSYSWGVPVVTGGVTGGVAGSGGSITGTLTNPTNAAQTATYTVTPTSGSCPGATFTVTVTVNPRPAITNMTTSICSANSFTSTPANGTNGVVPAGTTYSWGAPVVTGGVTGGVAGSGGSITGTLTNPTNTAQTATYTVTPTAVSCPGATFTVTVTVNPAPAVTNMTATICGSGSFTSTPANGTNGVVPAGTTYSWGVPVVTGGVTGGAAGSGASITGTLTNPTNAAQTATYTGTPTSGFCPGATFTVTVTLNPVPAVTNMTAAICSTNSFTSTPANGTNGVVPAGTTYSWGAPVVTGGVTGGAAGSGASITGTLTNPTNTAQTGTYTVTPTAGSCPGATFTVTVTVNPAPAVTNMTATICGSGSFTSTPANGTNGVVPAGTTYSWGVPVVTGGVTGGAAGSGASITGTLTNPTNTAQTATYTVTPTSGSCPGATFTVTVTVNPVPNVITTVTNPSACGLSDGSITLSGLNPSTGYTLSYSDDGTQVGPTAITSTAGGTYIIPGLNAGGYSNIIITFGGCNSTPASVSLSDPSSPLFTVSLLTNPTTCGGTQGSIYIEGTGTLSPSTLYSLTYTDNGASVGPVSITTDGNGDYNITGLNAGSYTSFILNLAGCTGSQPSPVILVDPTPPTATAGTTTPTICDGATINLTGNTVPGATYSWSGPNLFTSISEDPSIGSATTAASGTYSLTIMLNNCVSLPSTVNVTVNATPVLTITDPAAVCSPATVNITAPPVTSGSTNVGTLTYWTDAGATTSLSTPSAVTTTGTYYIQATNTGCTDIAPISVTVVTTPNVVTNNPAAVCSPLTVDLTAAAVTAGSTNLAALTYWTDAGATNALATPGAVTTSGTYYIQSGISGCVDIASVVVTVNQTPNLTITDPAAVCSPATVNITAPAVTSGSTNVGTLTYWTDAWATTSLSTPSAVTTTGTYYIQATNAGCTDIAPISVTVVTTPNVVTNNPAAVCSPLTVDLTAPAVTAGSTNLGALTYWTDAAATIALVTPGAVTTSGTYYIQSGISGCVDIASVVVTVNQTPNLTITDPAAVCSPATVNITAPAVTSGSTNVGTLTYWTDAGATTSLSNPSAVTTTGTYYIQATNAGCTDIQPVVATIYATPTFTLAGTDPSLCNLSDGSITISGLTASTNYTIGYSDDGTAVAAAPYTSTAVGTITITGLDAGAYNNFSVTITSSGCTGTSATTITLNNPGAPVITDLADQTVCDTYALPAITIAGVATTQGYYTAPNGGGVQLAVGSSVTSTQTIYIYVVNGTCTDEETVLITVNNTPAITVTDPAAVCTPATVDITAAAVTAGSTSLGTMTYWSDAAATVAVSAPSAIATSGTYYIQSSNGACTDIEPVTVIVNQTPVLAITNPLAVCSPLTVDITEAAVTAGSTNATNLTYWTDAGATTSLSAPSAVTTTGTYYIQATNAGCTDIAPVVVVVNATPAQPTAGTDSTYCSNWDLVNMTVSGTGGIYTWYTDPGLATLDMYGTGTSILPQDVIGSTTYYVTETLNGCEGPASTVTITIQDCEIIVPTAFTPNTDGVHDTWEIVDLDDVYPNNVVTIYNRWGNVVYQSEEGQYSSNPWDGTYNGEALPVASYYFVIDFNETDVDPRTGTVTIILNK